MKSGILVAMLLLLCT